jgi:protein TonB
MTKEEGVWCILDHVCGGYRMGMRVSFVVVIAAMLMTGIAGAGAQSSPQASEKPSQDSAAPVVPAGSKDKPVRVSSGVIAGLILHKVDPIYPEDAREAGVSGTVVMAALIDDQGKITKLTIMSGTEKLRDAALNAVNQWTYKPYLLNGKPVFVQTQITVNFSIAH